MPYNLYDINITFRNYMYTYSKAQVSDQFQTIDNDFQSASGKAKEDSS